MIIKRFYIHRENFKTIKIYCRFEEIAIQMLQICEMVCLCSICRQPLRKCISKLQFLKEKNQANSVLGRQCLISSASMPFVETSLCRRCEPKWNRLGSPVLGTRNVTNLAGWIRLECKAPYRGVNHYFFEPLHPFLSYLSSYVKMNGSNGKRRTN